MAKVLVNDSSLTNIADAIRTKKESTDKYKPSEMADAILSIKSDVSKEEQTKSLDITANGDYDILPDSGKVLSKATVNVNVPIPTVKEEQSKRVDITKNGVFAVQPDKGKVLSSATVFVNVPVPDGYIVPNGTKEITENGTHDVTEYSSVNVNVESVGGNSDLPVGYSRVDFIEFDGSQIVDTGFIGNQDTEINVCFTRENSNQRYLLGCASSDNTAAVTIYLGGTWRFGNKSASKSVSTTHEKLTYLAILNKTNLTISGSVTSISGVNDFETIGTILFGGCRSANGNLPVTLFAGKVFSFVMLQGGEQILKLVPVVNAEGEYRFFDLVSKTFFDSITDTPLDGGNL